MVSIPLLDKNGKDAGSLQLKDDIFAVKVNPTVIWQTEHWFMASARAGTASSKTRAEVSGGGKKPWKQKGTGRARAGSIRSPLWDGGGVVFGPKPRSYGYRLPKKVRKLALKGVISQRIAAGKFKALKNISLSTPKTKELLSVLKPLSMEGKILILVDGKESASVQRAGANLKKVSVLTPGELNIHSLLWAEWLVFTEEALKNLEGALKS